MIEYIAPAVVLLAAILFLLFRRKSRPLYRPEHLEYLWMHACEKGVDMSHQGVQQRAESSGRPLSVRRQIVSDWEKIEADLRSSIEFGPSSCTLCQQVRYEESHPEIPRERFSRLITFLERYGITERQLIDFYFEGRIPAHVAFLEQCRTFRKDDSGKED